MLATHSILIALVALIGAGEQSAPSCPVSIELEATQFRDPGSVRVRLVSSGLASVFLYHPRDGALGYSVERLNGPESDTPTRELISIQPEALDPRIQNYVFTKPELLGIHWREVGVLDPSKPDEFSIPPGHYRVSILASPSKLRRTGDVQVWRMYSRAFYVANSEKWVSLH
jgi:hypothetical protein